MLTRGNHWTPNVNWKNGFVQVCKYYKFSGKKRFEVITFDRIHRFQVILIPKFKPAIEYLRWKNENSRAQITWRPRDGYCSLWKLGNLLSFRPAVAYNGRNLARGVKFHREPKVFLVLFFISIIPIKVSCNITVNSDYVQTYRYFTLQVSRISSF